jgi:hypothetical protein
MAVNPNAELFLNDSRGVYIPRDFAECVQFSAVRGVSTDDFAILAIGPDHKEYWEAWDTVLQNCTLVNQHTNVTYYLYQDGDLWIIPVGECFDDEEC